MSPAPDRAAQRLGIVADDLTGAMDSSGHFAAMGLSTEVVLDPRYAPDSDVVVITTNSRADPPDVAREAVRRAVRRLPGRTVYKKIDSTLRGNIGVELRAAMRETACTRAIVAPAFPAVGRTTLDGVLLVDGIPVAETQFASDPVSPVSESHIPTLLARSTGHRAGLLHAGQMEASPETLHRHIEGMPDDVVVCDATEQRHLRTIVEAAALAGTRWLLCGSGGMARELHYLLGDAPTRERKSPADPSERPSLTVVGTRNPVTADQLQKAVAALGLAVVELDVERLRENGDASGEADRVAAEAGQLIDAGKSVALTCAFSRHVPGLEEAIPLALATAAQRIAASHRLGGLFLSGGDIAVAVCDRLSVSAIRVHGEVEPGIPAGQVTGGRADGMRVVTKAGGFGTPDAVLRSMEYLERGMET